MEWNGLARAIQSEINVSELFVPGSGAAQPVPKPYKGVWDTGATGSAITAKVARELGLKPIGMTKVSTAAGVVDQNEYLVNFYLPNSVAVHSIRVTEGVLSGDIDILIGMDIIRLGDFVITNKGGKTLFSFRTPSCEKIDFVTTHAVGPMMVNGHPPEPANRAERRRLKKLGHL